MPTWLFFLSLLSLPIIVMSANWKSEYTVNLQSFQPELLQPLTESVCSGYNGALLICGVPTERICTLTYHSIIKQVRPKTKLHLILAGRDVFSQVIFLLTLSQLLANLFSRMLSRVKEELFISVSSLQVCVEKTVVPTNDNGHNAVQDNFCCFSTVSFIQMELLWMSSAPTGRL